MIIAISVASIFANLTIHDLCYLLALSVSRLIGSGELPAQTRRGGIQTIADQIAKQASQNSSHGR